MRALIILPLLAAVAACATKPPEPEVITKTRTVDTTCERFKPVCISKADVLTRTTADQILDNNKAGASACGWKPADCKTK